MNHRKHNPFSHVVVTLFDEELNLLTIDAFARLDSNGDVEWLEDRCFIYSPHVPRPENRWLFDAGEEDADFTSYDVKHLNFDPLIVGKTSSRRLLTERDKKRLLDSNISGRPENIDILKEEIRSATPSADPEREERIRILRERQGRHR